MNRNRPKGGNTPETILFASQTRQEKAIRSSSALPIALLFDAPGRLGEIRKRGGKPFSLLFWSPPALSRPDRLRVQQYKLRGINKARR